MIDQSTTGQKPHRTVVFWSCWPFKAQSDPDSREKDESNAVRIYIESGTALRNPFSEAGSQTLEPLNKLIECSFDGLLCDVCLCTCTTITVRTGLSLDYLLTVPLLCNFCATVCYKTTIITMPGSITVQLVLPILILYPLYVLQPNRCLLED